MTSKHSLIGQSQLDPEAVTDNTIFEDSTAFSQYIEIRSVRENRPCNEILLDFCEKKDIDIDDIKNLISKPLREKMKVEMIDAGMHRPITASLDDIDG